MVSGWTPNGEIGVFIQAEAHQAIYTVPASGGKAVQVSDEGYAWYPRWSSDGERIYARAFRDEETPMTLGYVPSAGGDVMALPVQAERTLVGRVPGGGFNVSPDGERIVMSAYQRPWNPEEGLDLWTIPLNGGRPTRLTRGGAFEGYPCWSPDGTWIAFLDFNLSEEGEYAAIYTVPAGGGEVRQLTARSDSVDAGAIAVSPDGERIAFLSNGAIKTIPTGGGEPEVLIADAKSGWRSDLSWSPDGTKIAYSGGGKIWIASADGGDPGELNTGLPEEARHGSFSWSPDGQKIAFVALIGGGAEFWLIGDFLPAGEDR
jgi:Tol biopolymer transport system component